MTRLSNRQYPMLQMFVDMKSDQYMSIEDAQQWDQRPFRSMLIRKWVSYRPGRGFYATPEGRQAMQEFLSTDIARHNPSSPLTAYFDPTAYGLRKPKRRTSPKRRLHAVAAA
jgi:hypothetical protein